MLVEAEVGSNASTTTTSLTISESTTDANRVLSLSIFLSVALVSVTLVLSSLLLVVASIAILISSLELSSVGSG